LTAHGLATKLLQEVARATTINGILYAACRTRCSVRICRCWGP